MSFSATEQSTATPQRIFVIPGTTDCANLGDVAMLQVALQRLRSIWPGAGLTVLTRDAATMRRHCPGVNTAPLRGGKQWLRFGALPKLFFPTVRADRRKNFPLTFRRALAGKSLWSRAKLRDTQKFAGVFFNADLVVLTGCGLITDVFMPLASWVLDWLDAAIRSGIPVVMMSQGIGPIENAQLRRRAAKVLPRVNAIFIRENRTTAPLLEKFGVPGAKIFFTGDDALQPAFAAAIPKLGDRIGVNLRNASYAALRADTVEIVRDVLLKHAARWRTELVGIPIRQAGENSDLQTLQHLLPASKPPAAASETPPHVIEKISACRIVVTGSYHAAVFALAQGIPSVAIELSPYYAAKFHGLAEQFGEGCAVLSGHDPKFSQKLNETVARLWQRAGILRQDLRAVAAKQIRLGEKAYAEIPLLTGLKGKFFHQFAVDDARGGVTTDDFRPSREQIPG